MTLRRLVAAAAAIVAVHLPASATSQVAAGPHVVVALIDTGVNPYHAAFRDDSPLAFAHPSTYLPGYPADAPALNITLDPALTYGEALALDEAVWASVERGRLYWIPGTRIVGAVRIQPGGASCPASTPVCTDRPIIDEHGHGTMTASRAASASGSLAPSARIVVVEGLGHTSVTWAGSQGWIDVQSNSWGNLGFPPVYRATPQAFATAATRQLVLAASGNGAGGFFGVTPWPTYIEGTMAAGVIMVGAHDNGRVAPWSGAPATIVADGYGGLMATHRHRSQFGPNVAACCTSASSPYAAGGAAAVVLEARRITGDTRTGVRDGIVAEGTPTESGPLDDGRLTLAEARELILHTAQARPVAGPHDGLLHWAGEPRAPELLPYGPAANPYCVGCYTLPVPWALVPDGPAAFGHIGYGAVDPVSVDLAGRVLRGEEPLPARPVEDGLYAADQAVRFALLSPA